MQGRIFSIKKNRGCKYWLQSKAQVTFYDKMKKYPFLVSELRMIGVRIEDDLDYSTCTGIAQVGNLQHMQVAEISPLISEMAIHVH